MSGAAPGLILWALAVVIIAACLMRARDLDDRRKDDDR